MKSAPFTNSEQREEALQQVLKLLDQFFAGHDEKNSLDALLSLVLLACNILNVRQRLSFYYYSFSSLLVYYKQQVVRSEVDEDDEQIIRDATHYFKFAASAYGWKLMNGLMFDNKEMLIVRGFMTGDQQNVYSLCEHTGIVEDDIVRN